MTPVRAAGAAVLLVGGVAALVYFSTRERKVSGPVIPEAAVAKREPAAPAPLKPVSTSLPCRIVPQQTVAATAQLTGEVDAVYVETGQVVTDGQVLARIRTSAVSPNTALVAEGGARQHAAEVTAQLAASAAEAKRLQAAVTANRATLARLEVQFQRQEQLNQAGATPRLVYEKARADRAEAASALAASEEASRLADNRASHLRDEKGQADETVVEKAKAVAAVAAGMASGEIHAPAAGLLVLRRIAPGGQVTEKNRAELFVIAVHPELLRAEFDTPLEKGQTVSLAVGDAQIRATVTDGHADFESRTGNVRPGGPCSASVQIN